MAAEPQPTAHSNAFTVLDAVNKKVRETQPGGRLLLSGTKSLYLVPDSRAGSYDHVRSIKIVDSAGIFSDMFLCADRTSLKVKLVDVLPDPHVLASATLGSVRVGSELPPVLNALRILLNTRYPEAWKAVHAAAEPGSSSVYSVLQSGMELNTALDITEGKLLLRVVYWADASTPKKPLLAHVMLLPKAAPSKVYYTSLLLEPRDDTSFEVSDSILKGKVVITPKEHRAPGQPYIYGTGMSNGISVSVRTPTEMISPVRTTQELLQRLAQIAVALVREAEDKRKRGLA